jgi:osomolarity two-component system response regulator SKN7
MGRKSYDLVLMDIMMPNLDGCSAAALIRQFNADTPIIAMTSNIRRDDINNYFNNGPARFLCALQIPVANTP